MLEIVRSRGLFGRVTVLYEVEGNGSNGMIVHDSCNLPESIVSQICQQLLVELCLRLALTLWYIAMFVVTVMGCTNRIIYT